jgi:hypothetical protein
MDNDFKPILTKVKRTPELLELSREEMIKLLPKSIQAEVKRAEWAWANIDSISGKEIVDPFTFEPIRERTFTKNQIYLLFDPPMIKVEGLSEEDNMLAYMASDPVLWIRFNLSVNPRLSQLLMLREDCPRIVMRYGRRSGKSSGIAMRIIYKSAIAPGNKSLVITPMKSHAEVVWNMIKELLRNNDEFLQLLESRGIRTSEQPHYTMTWPNHSEVNMFTSGVRSKNHADTVRGQEADDMYLDEVDLMDGEDLPAFTAIIRDTGAGMSNTRRQNINRQKTMVVSSTPNGRRDMMWRFCTEFRDENILLDHAYVEYYFPTHADINYTRADDAEQRMMLTREQYLHEIVADFGEETSGVFLKVHLERAISHYKDGYSYLPIDGLYRNYAPDVKLVLGVDWDKFGAGVNMILCQVNYAEKEKGDPDKGRIKPIARWEIPRGSETLTQATDFIKTVNYRFNPDAIYIDRGFGEMQYEDLMISATGGKDPRTVGLDKKLRGVHFAEKVEVFDPITNEPVGKEVKDYMVTLTIKLFEDDRIILNCNDYEEVPPTDMIKQMEMYQVIRKTMSGRPIYEAGSVSVGDHALDAFMLCVLAQEQEWGPFSRVESHTRPLSFDFNVMDISTTNILDPKKDNSDVPDKFRIARSNIKGRISHSSSRKINRKNF